MIPDTLYVVVSTDSRYTYVGEIDPDHRERSALTLQNARMVVRWGTTRGLPQLAAEGPTASTTHSPVVPSVTLQGVTTVNECTDAARTAWLAL